MKIEISKIDLAYAQLSTQKVAVYEAAEALVDAKAELDNKVAVLINTGQIVGKNQQERDAKTQELCAPELNKVFELQKEYDEAKLEHELASLEVERLRLLIRLIEITKEEKE